MSSPCPIVVRLSPSRTCVHVAGASAVLGSGPDRPLAVAHAVGRTLHHRGEDDAPRPHPLAGCDADEVVHRFPFLRAMLREGGPEATDEILADLDDDLRIIDQAQRAEGRL